MKLAILADPHLKPHLLDRHPGRPMSGQLQHLDCGLAIAREKGCQQVLCCGDLFDDPKVWTPQLFTTTIQRKLSRLIHKHRMPWLLCLGNHERPDNLEQASALAMLEDHPLCTVVERPRVFWLGSVAVGVIPWPHKAHFLAQPENSNLDAERQDIRWNEACRNMLADLKRSLHVAAVDRTIDALQVDFRIVIGHAEVSGSTDSRNHVLTGKTFPLSGMDLAELGADAYFFGHYHKRQPLPLCQNGWYVGAYFQESFGAEGDPVGFAILDTETRQIEWVDLPEVARHYTLRETEPGVYPAPPASYRPGVDVLKEQGTKPSGRDLADGEVFEPVTVPRELTARTSEALDPSAPLASLLPFWAASGLDLTNELLDLASHLDARVGDAGTWHRGSLTRLLRIRVRGIIPFAAEADVDLSSTTWVGVSGKNGGGKTTLVESVLACWFGTWAHPDRDLYGSMAGEEARIEVLWESGGKAYRAVRTLTVRGSVQKQSLILSRVQGASEVALAGPKVRDAEAAIEQLVGSKAYLLGSIILSQQAEGDLVDAPTPERQRFMQRLLNLLRFELAAEVAKGEGDKLTGDIGALERAGAEVPDLPALQAEVGKCEAVVVQYGDGLRFLEESLAVVREEYARLSAVQTQHAELQKGLQGAQNASLQAQQRVTELEARAESLRGRLTCEPELQAQAALLEATRSTRDRIRQQEGAIATWTADKRRLEQGVTHAQAALLRAQESHQERLASLVRDTAALAERKAAHDLRAASLQELGCAKQGFLPCRLLDVARKEVGEAPDWSTLELSLEQRQEAIDLVELEGHPEESALFAAQKALAELGPAPELPEASAAETDRLLAQQEAAARALAALAEVRTQLSQTEADTTQARAAFLEAAAQVDLAAQALADAEDVGPRLEEQLQRGKALRFDVDAKKAELAQAQQELGSARAELVRGERLAEEAQKRAAELEQLRVRRDNWRTLQQACGRDGIPQLLVSAALPALQAVLDEVCSVDFGGRFGVRLDTVRKTKTAGAREGFEVIFCRRGNECDARKASGGEKAAVRAALRCALVLYQAQQASETYRVAVLDEPAAHQDQENAEATLRALARLRDRFEQILIISHSEDQLASLEHHIVLEQGPRGSRIADIRVLVGAA